MLAKISFADKETNYFETNADGLKKAKFDTGSKYYQQDIASIEASFLEALRITKTMKPHTIAEDLLLSAAKDIVQIIIRYRFVIHLSVEEYMTCLLIFLTS